MDHAVKSLHRAHRVLASAVITAITLTTVTMSAAEPNGPSLLTFVEENGPGCFALSLRDTAEQVSPRAMDLAIVVDLSASQTGPARKESIALVRSLLGQLVGGSRVQIWSSHQSGKEVLPKSAAVGSPSITAGLELLENAAPVGVSDLPTTFEKMSNWLADRNGNLPKRILIVGDGQTTSAKPVGLAYDQFAKQAREAGAGFFFAPIHQMTPSAIDTLVTQTGGVRWTSPSEAASASHELLAVLSQPILIVDKITLDPVPTALFPSELPPIRNDRSTLVVGEGAYAKNVAVKLEGTRDGEAMSISLTAAAKPSPENRYLRPLVDRWSQRPALSANVDAAVALRQSRELLEANTEVWTAQAKAALAERRLDDANALFSAALTWEPNNPEAEAGLHATQKLQQKGSADPRPVTELPKAPIVTASTSASDREPSKDTLSDAKARQLILKQQATRLVTDALEESRREGKNDPQMARQILKRSVQTIDASDLDSDTKAKLRSRMESQLRILFREQQRSDADMADRTRALAQASARSVRQTAELSRQQQDKQLLDEFRGLLNQGQYTSATRVAEQVVQNSPDNVAALASQLQGQLADRYAQNEFVENARQQGWWNTLQAVEVSAIPQPDNRPIVFPGAKEWEELTKRREKYKAPTLAPVSPAEERIRKALTKSITFDFRETPLSDVAKFVQDFAGINVIVDQEGLDEAGVDADEPVTLNLQDIPLKSSMKLLLGPLDLAYLIQDDVLLITSKEKAESILVTKVYPVADLVIPIANFNSGVGSNGQQGGGGLGQQGGGGLGGGGFGNAGGGGAGLGNQGGGGRGFPRPISKGLRQILDAMDKDTTSTDETNRWDKHLAAEPESDESLRGTVAALIDQQKYREAIDLLHSISRHQEAPAWVYPALALATQLYGSEPDEVRQAILSIVDRNPADLPTRLLAAERLARAGQKVEAFQLLRNTADEFGPSVNVFFLSLRLAADERDIETLMWSTENLLSHEWPSEGEGVHGQTRTLVARAVTDLRAQGKTEDADRLQRLSQAARIRDIQVSVHWEGEADIDLAVVEPSNLLCSPLTPRTVGGGVLATDSKGTTEKYVAAEAWSGEYEIRLQPVWGKPTGGIANIDIVLHQGTDHERRERRTVQITDVGTNGIPPIKIKLENGRRQQLAVLSPDRDLLYVGEKPGSDAQARAQLRQRVQNAEPIAEPAPFPPAGRFGRRGQGVGGAVGGGGAIAFDPVITPIPSGTMLTAQAVVSADRRFVRLQMVPVIQNIQSIQDVRTISVGGAVSGGGGNLPAGQNP